MKAAKFSGEYAVAVVEKPKPQPKAGEILIKVAYCGLCGSERKVLKGGFDVCTPGHETSGVVECCGDTPAKFEKGTEVLIYLIDYCGVCPACKAGKTNQCINRRGLVGWNFDGGYEEYVSVPAHMVFPLDGVSLKMGVLALDTIGTAFHGMRLGKITRDETVLVIGCGPIGLGAVSILKNHYNVKNLYAADVSSYHLEKAKELGAIPLKVDPADTAGSIKKQLPGTVDTVMEIVGADATIAAAVKIVKPEGKVVYIGEPEVALNIPREREWILKDFYFINSWYFPVNEIEENLSFIRKYPREVEKIATHEFPIEKMTEAYKIFGQGETGKALVKF